MTEMTERELPPPDGDDAAAPRAQRCPACGAVRPPAVAWCTQCYARFDVPPGTDDPDEVRDDRAADGPVAAAVDPALGPAHQVRPDDGQATPPEEIEARAQEMLAQLSAQGSDDPRVGSWSARLRGRGTKLAVVAVGTLVLTGLAVAAMAVLGALL